MTADESAWKVPATEIDARRAPVAPRASLHPGQASLPIDQQFRKLLDKRFTGVVCLAGESGSGRSTALAHLAATVGDDARVAFLDRPFARCPTAQPGQVLVYTCHAPDHSDSQVLLKMSPWGTEDLIEYLLATHPGRCRSVMARVERDPAGLGALRGLPELCRIVIDEMAADDEVADVESAFLRHISRSLLTAEDWNAAGRYCLNTIAPCAGALNTPPVIDLHVGRLIRHRIVALMLAAVQMAKGLADKTVAAELRVTLPESFIDRCGALLPQYPAALERLKEFVSGDDSQLHAMAASLLHAARDPWRPFERPSMDLSYARLGGADWPGVELPNSRMAGTNFAGAMLDGADLRFGCMDRARLAGASLAKAMLLGARFCGADLRGAKMNRVLAYEAKFADADLTSARFHHARLRGSRFRGARLNLAAFVAADLAGSDFRHAVLDGTDFTGANLDRARLPYQPLSTCILDRATLTGADLRRCDLEGMTVSGADFSEAGMKDSLLTGSVLRHCKFRRTDLRNSGLADIDWEGADLRKSDLRRSSFHMGSTRSGLVASAVPCEGSRTGFYTDEFNDRHFKNPEEIRRANLRYADLRGAKTGDVDFYLVDLRGARYSKKQRNWFARCGAILD